MRDKIFEFKHIVEVEVNKKINSINYNSIFPCSLKLELNFQCLCEDLYKINFSIKEANFSILLDAEDLPQSTYFEYLGKYINTTGEELFKYLINNFQFKLYDNAYGFPEEEIDKILSWLESQKIMKLLTE